MNEIDKMKEKYWIVAHDTDVTDIRKQTGSYIMNTVVDKTQQRYLQEIINGCPNCKRHDIDLVSRFDSLVSSANNNLHSIARCQNCGNEKIIKGG